MAEESSEIPYAVIADWAVFELSTDDPNRAPTRHILGYTVSHARFGCRLEPYIGSSLTELDLDRREARNAKGKLIVLTDEALPKGTELPYDLMGMFTRAEWAWGVSDENPQWMRVD
jgi:hypothetical protein